MMKNKVLGISFFLFLLSMCFVSCDAEPLDSGLGGQPDPVTQVLFAANFNGINYTTNSASASVENGTLTIQASNSTGVFVLHSLGAVIGTYTNSQLHFTYTDNATGNVYHSINPATQNSNSTLTVTAINFQNQSITGTFSFIGYRMVITGETVAVEEVIFTQGTFLNIPYGSGIVDPVEPEPSTGDYFPMAVGNTWNYDMSNEEENNQIKINSTETIGGVLYYKITDLPISTGVDVPAEEIPELDVRSHLRKDGANYYQRFYAFIPEMMGGLIPQTEIETFEIIFLKDNLNVGESWIQEVDIVTNVVIFDIPQTIVANAVFTSVIEQKGINLVVNGVTYNDVIKVKTTASVVSDEGTEVSTAENWYAKDIGLIRSYSNDAEEGESDMTLLDYILN